MRLDTGRWTVGWGHKRGEKDVGMLRGGYGKKIQMSKLLYNGRGAKRDHNARCQEQEAPGNRQERFSPNVHQLVVPITGKRRTYDNEEPSNHCGF